MIIKEVISCVFGTLFFAVTMRVPKGCFKFVILGAAITSLCERTLYGYYGELISCMAAMLCLVFFCELVSRTVKIPSTVILMPSTIPLLPGSSIYYAMFYAVSGDAQKFLSYGKSTLFTGIGISLGAVIASIIIKTASKNPKP